MKTVEPCEIYKSVKIYCLGLCEYWIIQDDILRIFSGIDGVKNYIDRGNLPDVIKVGQLYKVKSNCSEREWIVLLSQVGFKKIGAIVLSRVDCADRVNAPITVKDIFNISIEELNEICDNCKCEFVEEYQVNIKSKI